MTAFTSEQRFLVTGAGSVIGRSCALLLNRQGATVIGLGRNADKLEATRGDCPAPERFFVCPFDLAKNAQQIPELIAGLRKEHGKLSGLCAAAGKFHMDSLRSFTLAASDEMNLINFQAPVLLAQNFSDRRNCIGAGASILFIAAFGGVLPQPGLLSYGAAKAALIAASKSLSKELGPRQIRVNAISPAIVRTPMTEGAYAGFMGYDVLAAEAPLYPLGLGEPADIAEMAVFLLSPAARWITGQNIIMDGGRF